MSAINQTEDLLEMLKEDKELKAEQDRLDIEAKKNEEIAKEKAEKELSEKRADFVKYRDSIDFDHFEDKD